MARKEDKLRPYRVDYFDIEEMKDIDSALVHSVVVRAVTATEALNQVQLNYSTSVKVGTPDNGRIIIRASRFYKKFVHKDVYKAIEDLFTTNKAVEVMDRVEAYRKAKIDESFKEMATDPQVSVEIGNKTILGDATRYEFSVTPVAPKPDAAEPSACTCHHCCESLETNGKMPCDCGCKVCTPAPAPTAPEQPATGPDSPATKAVVADLQGMLAHDAHEQTMDTFVPDDVPEGKRFPDPTNTPIIAPVPVAVEQPKSGWAELATPETSTLIAQAATDNAKADQDQPTAGRAPTSWTFGLGNAAVEEPLIEPDKAVGCSARPPFNKPSSTPIPTVARVEAYSAPANSLAAFPLWANVLIFSGALIAVIYGTIKLLHH